MDEKEIILEIEKQGEVTINVLEEDITKVTPELEDLVVTPSEVEQKFKSNKYGFENVTVKAVETEELNATSSTENQVFEGLFGKVNIAKIETEETTITPSVETQIKQGLFNKVTVTGDEDLKAENIKAGVNIFGVNGIFEGEETNKYNTVIKPFSTVSAIYCIEEISNIDFSNASSSGSKGFFANCRTLAKIGSITNTSHLTSTQEFFNNCYALQSVPLFDTSNVVNIANMFSGCSVLTTVPLFNTSKVTQSSNLFSSCTALTSVPLLDSSTWISFIGIFQSCSKLTSIPAFNTSNVTSFNNAFYNCTALTTLPLYETGKVTNISNALYNCTALTTFGGFKDLGKGYTQKSNSHYTHKLDLSYCQSLTHDSLMNVINNLYDLNLTYKVATGGTLYTQQLTLGATNLAKLTDSEIAIATNKGWTVS